MGARALAALATMTLAGFALSPAYGFSPVTGYRVPTNYELVSEADLIVIATLTTERAFNRDWQTMPTLRLNVLRTLKGSSPTSPLIVEGVVGPDPDGRKIPPIYTRLDEAHPDVWQGGCNRMTYAAQTPVVMMFKKDKETLVHFAPPFSRASEDVPDAGNTTWVKAIETYAAIAALPAVKRRAALIEARRKFLSGHSSTDRAIASDIGFALNPAHPASPDLQKRTDALEKRFSGGE